MAASITASHAVNTKTKNDVVIIIGLPKIRLEPNRPTNNASQTASDKKKKRLKSVVNDMADKNRIANIE